MVTKLTLTMDKEIIEKAKAYAKESGRSLSSIAETYFRNLTTRKYTQSETADWQVNEDSLTYEIMQIAKKANVPDDIDYKEEIEKYREEKYQKYLSNDKH